ncbi:hypothetical protein Y900_031040 [Mycolicibacterium aromaticivorans JS19b1 = JCM 16368]|uniref:Uncharacterized protein n=1 Tax=Mycolicibacterium aromaticivorans JS19b1 = JCM 16368 TaxID=1440774 RepID=A0A064CD39_9MYCO|nr:hypothetical protein [Mycolicibacterium aromaticivorans]KDE96657.1 hypothetical protein Y900_031040 [Mycolicibacterium aromaticivorans JS19b1 = JCM 16368]
MAADDANSAAPHGPLAPTTAAAVLRARLLEDIDDDVLPMAHVQTLIDRHTLAVTAEEHHALVLDVLGSLLHENLIQVGDVLGGDPTYFDPWPGTPEAILDRIRSLYIDHYTDPTKWDLSIWICPHDERKTWHPNTID